MCTLSAIYFWKLTISFSGLCFNSLTLSLTYYLSNIGPLLLFTGSDTNRKFISHSKRSWFVSKASPVYRVVTVFIGLHVHVVDFFLCQGGRSYWHAHVCRLCRRADIEMSLKWRCKMIKKLELSHFTRMSVQTHIIICLCRSSSGCLC